MSRFLSPALVVATALVGTACTNRVEAPKPEPAETASEVRRHEHRGPLRMLVRTVVEHGDLSEEQHDEILAIQDRATAARLDRRAIKQRLRLSASTIVRSGTADSDDFDGAVDITMGAIEYRVSITADAIKEIHAVLDARQRLLVAAALRERVAEKFERREKHRETKRARVEKVKAYLMLTDDQMKKLEEIRNELVGDDQSMRTTHAQVDDLVKAFEGDDFATELDAFQASKLEILRGRAAHMAGHADTALSVFSVDQRELLADLIEVGPEALGLGFR